MGERDDRLLTRLSASYGLETAYRDASGQMQTAAPRSLLAVLRALGAQVESLADLPGALRERRLELWRRSCEPVSVAWDGKPVCLEIRLPASQADKGADCRLELESGEVRRWTCDLAKSPVLRVAKVDGADYEVRQIILPFGLPWGYHKFSFALPGRLNETMLIAAPLQAYSRPAARRGRIWGVFLPLYALHSSRSWAAGDFSDLHALLRWVKGQGGSLVGTLPLLAAFLDEPFDPSPYAPASRLFWNEFYLDLTCIPELQRCPPALDLLNSSAFRREIAALKSAPLVDYSRGLAVKRRILEILAGCCSLMASGRQAVFKRWEEAHPRARDYARFRAVVEKRRTGWQAWPGRMREGVLLEGDYDPAVERYHLYAQWLAFEQLQALAKEARREGVALYLDMPLGVHSAGYDVWRERAAFALGASCGAPPDPFTAGGQDWGFPPLHPERIRRQGYHYYIACLRHHLQHAGVLRLDHVMGLHHLYWVPGGLTAKEGVYVRYRAEEFYAILALESHRYCSQLVGEDLGTVPLHVRASLARHKIDRMYILPFELDPLTSPTLQPIPARALAALNTHDMPPFSAFWIQEKQDKRAALAALLRRRGWLEEDSRDELKAILAASLKHLAASRVRMLLINLEDLWLEASPQNIPGTYLQYPNWRRKSRYSMEEWCVMPEVVEVIKEIQQLRGQKKSLRRTSRLGFGGDKNGGNKLGRRLPG